MQLAKSAFYESVNVLNETMGRKDKEITGKKEIESILQRAEVCRIALSDNNTPYVIPVSFGYKNNCLYFHSAGEGKKIEILKKNNKVCFEVEYGISLLNAGKICDWGMKYCCVVGYGRAYFINSIDEKRRAMDTIIAHYTPTSFKYADNELKNIAVIRIEIESIKGRKSGY